MSEGGERTPADKSSLESTLCGLVKALSTEQPLALEQKLSQRQESALSDTEVTSMDTKDCHFSFTFFQLLGNMKRQVKKLNLPPVKETLVITLKQACVESGGRMSPPWSRNG